MRRASSWVGFVVALLVVCSVTFAGNVPWEVDKAAKTDLPLVFRGRAAERLAAEEVARQDGYRKLIERVYGLALDSQTDVQDLALASRRIDTSLRNKLKGVKKVGKKYYDDGRVEIALKITLREVVEIVKKTYKQVRRGERLIKDEIIENIRRENRDKEIVVVGRGALRGSEGLKKIRAMRAAEVDCYERITARVFGMRITANTTVRDFVLESDSIRSKVSMALLNGVKFLNYEFFDNGTTAATGQMTIREVVEILTRTYNRYARGSKVSLEDIENIVTKTRDIVIVEVGRGTVRQAAGIALGGEAFEQTKMVVERVLSRKIVVE